MLQRIALFVLLWNISPAASPAELSVAPPDELLRVYAELRALKGSDQFAVTENVVWKRDAATFTFTDGRMTFAAPVAGRVVAAYFEGQGRVELNPPTAIAQRQIARFTRSLKLEDSFRSAVFFFTDQSWTELQQLMKIKSGGDALAAGKALESAQKRYVENFNDWIDNLKRGNFTMRNMPARMLADLTDPSSRGFFLADFEGERSGNLLYQITWNRDPILLPDFSNDEEVMLIRYKRNEYFEWWGGFHLKEEYARAAVPEHRALLAHCRESRINAEISKDNHLSATADMEVEVPAGPARLLPLTLNGVLRITSLEDGEGRKLAFIQEDRKLDSDPWVILPEPAVPNRVFHLRITYQEDSTSDSRVIDQRGSGLYYVQSRESWFPSLAAFDDRTRYLLHLRSPKRFKFIATGHLVKSEQKGDFLETDWESEIPYSVIGFNYGDFVDKSQSDPNLTVTAYAGREIPDELKGVQSMIEAAQLAGGPNRGDVASELGIMTGGFNTSRLAGYSAGVSYQALKLFEFYFGQLPFKSVSVTQQPVRGYGQSWPTLIFLPYDSLLDSTTRQSLRMQDSAEAREFYNVVAVHEMAHQWWGHLVGWKTYHDEWLSEGFAEFSAALYLRQFEPKKWDSFWELKRKWLLSSNRVGHRPVDVGPLWLNYQLNAHLEGSNRTFLVYYKGAYVLEMLRVLMNNPRVKNSDERFIAMMKDFVSTYAGKNASTEDFRRVVEKHTGEPMDWFFNQWVYGTEVPTYNFTYQLIPGEGTHTLFKFSLTQSGVSDSFQMRIPMYAWVNGRPGRLGFLLIQGPKTVTDQIDLPFRPEKITLDETHSILCTIKQ